MSSLLAAPSPHLPYPAVLDWTSILLDVHFAQLSLVPECKHLLFTLRSRVCKQASCAHMTIVYIMPLKGVDCRIAFGNAMSQ